ncbi:T9SS type A sorting domain-containing protein [Flavobacterium sp.]|uniref:T9SS type A sorting domain-containing protein n=1 Tax=Flavobacterium sp. TaxID=239 RepID=UPI002FDD7082
MNIKKRHLFILLLSCCFSQVEAQVGSYTFYRNGSQFPYITTTGPNVTVHTVSDDIVLPAIVTLPFSFNFGGVSHTSLGISENGYIWFGAAQPSELSFIAPISSTQSAAVQGIVSALGIDLHPIDIPEAKTTIKSAVVGQAPNRTFIIEWFATARIQTLDHAAGPDIIDFQIQLSESTHAVAIAFGRTILNPNFASDVEMGLKTSDTDFNVRTTTSPSWNTAAGPTLNDTCLLSSLSKPAFGNQFVWTPSALGVGDFNPDQVVLYPIPATQQIQVGGLPESTFDYVIYDMTGRTISQNSVIGTTIALDGLSSGNYIINITSGDLSLSRKFVKI